MRQVSHGQTALNVSTYLLGRCRDNTDLSRPHHTMGHHTNHTYYNINIYYYYILHITSTIPYCPSFRGPPLQMTG